MGTVVDLGESLQITLTVPLKTLTQQSSQS